MNIHNRSFEDQMAAMRSARDADAPSKLLGSQLQNEQNLLGAIMIDADVLDDMPPEFADHHFEDDVHANIFREAVRIRAAGKMVNPLTIKTQMPKAPAMIGDLTFVQYLTKMVRDTVGPSGAVSLAFAITDGFHRRQLQHIGQDIVSRLAFEHETSIADEIKIVEDRLADIRNERSGKEVGAAGDSYIAMFQASTSLAGIVGVPLCLPEIARVLSEPVLEAGNLYGFLSSSGEGKTSLTVEQIYHAIKEGHPVLFLSYDQSAGQCVRQMIAQVHGIEGRRQREPTKFLKPEEQNKCLDFAMWINRQPLEIIRCQREGVSQLIAYARRFVKKKGNGKTPMVIIDHIGKVKPRDPKLSPDRISGDITVELKAFADEAQAVVMVLNQRNGEGSRRNNPRPIAKDLYGGEGARADYDAVMYLYRSEKYRDEMVKIASSDADWKIINRVFGDEDRWKGIAELGAIKVRFGNPNITEDVKFEAQFTRYVSMRPNRVQEELL